jgi:5'-nucleotidase
MTEIFNNQRVAFKDKQKFYEKVNRLVSDGPDYLQIVTDFDYTLTKFFNVKGTRALSCHSVIEDCGMLHDDYHYKAKAIQRKYYPIEVDPLLSNEEKTKYMIEWVYASHDLLIENQVTKEIIQLAALNAIKNENVRLRDGVVELFKFLETFKIPTLVFSAGIADVLEHLIACYTAINPEFVYIISNRCIFDVETKILVGFEDPVIHVFNKQASSFLHTEFFQHNDLNKRKNLILIGDSLTDLKMSEGMPHEEDSMLKIGFLNDKVDERREQYLQAFDIVIFDDPLHFSIPQYIIELICNRNSLLPS